MSENSDFGTFGRYRELPIEKMTADQKIPNGFTMKERGQVPGPYKIFLQNPKLIEVMVPLGAYYQGHSSLSKAEIEIATNLTNARWLAAYSNYEHEMIAEKDGGLPPEKVQALIAGLPTSFDEPSAASSLRNHVGFDSASRRPYRALSTRSKSFGGHGPYGFDRTHWIFHLHLAHSYGLRRSRQCHWFRALKSVSFHAANTGS